MQKLSGPLLMATGVLDLLYVFVFHYRQLAAIARDGFFNAVEPGVASATFNREVAFWHLMFGAMVLVLGGLIHWTQARTGTLPASLGWSLLALAAAGVVLMPASGFWIVLPQAAMIAASRQKGSGTAGGGGGPPHAAE